MWGLIHRKKEKILKGVMSKEMRKKKDVFFIVYVVGERKRVITMRPTNTNGATYRYNISISICIIYPP